MNERNTDCSFCVWISLCTTTLAPTPSFSWWQSWSQKEHFSKVTGIIRAFELSFSNFPFWCCLLLPASSRLMRVYFNWLLKLKRSAQREKEFNKKMQAWLHYSEHFQAYGWKWDILVLHIQLPRKIQCLRKFQLCKVIL